MKYLAILIYLSILTSCNTSPKGKVDRVEPIDTTYSRNNIFIDSTTVGVKGNNKIEIIFQANDEKYLREIIFYEKQNARWIETQRYIKETPHLGFDDIDFIDYNNDGYSDFSMQSSIIPARGSNELRNVFIFKPETKRLVEIKNAEDYPNLAYNSSLSCLYSHSNYGGSTTSFLKLEDDHLVCIATVSLYEKERQIVAFDKNGNEEILLLDTLGNPDCVYMMATTFEVENFLEEYNEYCEDQ